MSGVLDLFRLDGKVAVITGASSGLGVGFAAALAQAGADVVLGARRADLLDQVRAKVADIGGEALPVVTDVSDPAQCTALVEKAMGHFGRVDVLINNAGIGIPATPATTQPPDEFRRVIDINLNGAYWMAQACGRVMQPSSSIVNISSVLGIMRPAVPQAAYAASKAGLIGLTRDLSQQWAGHRGIRVNAVAPGYFETEMTAVIPHDVLAGIVGSSTLGRLGRPDELNAMIVFLASPASGYITGATIAVDGGMSGH